jgi:hypothetical protein
LSLEPGTRIRRRPRVVWRELAGEAVLLDLDGERYFGLDEVGTRVWILIEEPRPLAELHGALLAEYAVGADELWRDLVELVDRLVAAGLAEVEPPPDAPGS